MELVQVVMCQRALIAGLKGGRRKKAREGEKDDI